jgi:hypothetical protein
VIIKINLLKMNQGESASHPNSGGVNGVVGGGATSALGSGKHKKGVAPIS